MGHTWEIVVRLRPTILAAGLAFAILALVMYLTRNLNWHRVAPLPGEA